MTGEVEPTNKAKTISKTQKIRFIHYSLVGARILSLSDQQRKFPYHRAYRCTAGGRTIATTKEELAAQLDGIQYPAHRAITKEHIAAAKEAGLVILYGASDDLMEFDGASRDEIGCYDGGIALVDLQGVLPDRYSMEEDYEIAEYVLRKRQARPIEALWCKEPGHSWTYKTDIPHATFEVIEDGEHYCRGIVFALADIAPLNPA